MASTRTLIAEDELIIGEHLSKELGNLGYEVVAVLTSGEEAIRVAEAERPDLVLMDISLQGDIDGIEAARHIQTTLNIPVVYLTASSDPATRKRASATEPFGYIIKPYQSQHLAATVEMALQKHDLEKRLRESDRQWKAAQALGSIGHWEFDVVTQAITWSDHLYVLYERDRSLGLPSVAEEASYYSPEDAERLSGYAGRSIATGETFDYSLDVKLPSGKTAHMISNMRPAMNASGQVIKLFGTVQDVTRRVQTEQELQERLFQLDSVLSHTPLVFSAVNLEGDFIFSEGKGLEKLGRKAGQMVGESVFEIYKDRPDILGYIQKAMQGDPVNAIVEIGEVTFDVFYEPIRDNTGSINGVVAVSNIITERKQTEEELASSELMLQNSQKIGRIGSFEMDIATGGVKWSDQLFDLFGMKRTSGPIENDKVLELIHPDDRERAIKVSSEAAQKGEPYELEHRVIHPGGKVLDLLIQGDAVRNDKNEVIKIAGTAQDITERKQAEVILRLQSEITVNMAEGVYLIRTSDWVIVYANPRFEEMFGYDPGEMIGKRAPIVNAPTEKDPEETAREITAFLEREGYWRGEVNNIKKDGTPFWCYASVTIFDHPEYGNVMVAVHTDITERKQAEEMLRKSEETLSSFMSSATEIFVLFDADLNYTFINDIGLALFPPGTRREDVVGKNILEIMPDIEEKGRYAEYQKVIRTGEPFSIDEAIPNPVFGDVFLNIRTFKVGDGLGMICEDVTERMQAEADFENIFNISPDMLTVCTTEGEFLQVNPTWEKVLGFQTEDILRLGWANLVHPDDVERTNNEVEKQLLGSPVVNFINRFRCKDGSYKTLEWQASYAVKGIVHASARDITERVQMEEALAEQRAFLRQVIDTNSNSIFVRDRAGRFTLMNRARAERLGSTIEDAIGKTIEELGFSKEQAERFTREDLEVMDTLQAKFFAENEITYPDGEKRWMQVAKHPITGPGGMTDQVLVVANDITERVRAVESLKAANVRLEALWSVSSLVDADIKAISDHILATITQMTGSDYGFYGFVNEDQSALIIHSWSGEAMRDCSIVDKPTYFAINEAGVWGEAVRRREPLILNNYSAPHPAKKGLPQGHVPLTNLLVVPFFSQDKITAVAAVANRSTDYDDDDVAQLSAFLTSIQAIVDNKRAEQALQESQARYQSLFENSPIALWEEDFSEVKQFMDNLRAAGVSDIRAYFEDNPDAVHQCIGLWKIIDVNQAALELYKAKSKHELIANVEKTISDEDVARLRESLIAMSEGRKNTTTETVQLTLTGEKIHITTTWLFAPGHEETWDKLLVSMVDITERVQAEEQIKASLDEKEVLLKEVHHRVKNNLQVISSLLNLQSNNIQNQSDKVLFANTEQRVHAMAIVHEKLYQSPDLARIDFAEYLQDLTDDLITAYRPAPGVTVSIAADPVFLGVDQAIPCGLIVNELISNALKYAFPEARSGVIEVSLQAENDAITLTISDNGIGLPDHIDLQNPDTLGLNLINGLAGQLNGEVVTNREEGTKFVIVFSNDGWVNTTRSSS